MEGFRINSNIGVSHLHEIACNRDFLAFAFIRSSSPLFYAVEEDLGLYFLVFQL